VTARRTGLRRGGGGGGAPPPPPPVCSGAESGRRVEAGAVYGEPLIVSRYIYIYIFIETTLRSIFSYT
jgi:hypothetical protein